MCEWGKTIPCRVKMTAETSHTGKARFRSISVDACLAPIVNALNAAKIYTAQACCGHGKRLGRIELHDGRTLIIAGGK